MLLLMRQRWRASINRFAEAMTLFAAAIAGLFPILHLGRPHIFLLAAALPEHDGAVAAVAQRADLGFLGDPVSYLLFSIIFWYVGLIPDLATLRDRARGNFAALRSMARWRSAGEDRCVIGTSMSITR